MKNKGQYRLFNTSQMTSTAAMRRLHRERALKDLPIKPVTGRQLAKPDYVNNEINLYDEERTWVVWLKPCHACGGRGQSMLVMPVPGSIKRTFQLSCRVCGFKASVFESSQKAAQNWNVMAALNQ